MNEKKATISIIVPVYNVSKYLPKCIDSILSQSFTDFELILVDDGSTDSSGDICDKYAGNDPRINVIHKNNAGVSEARNTGLDLAVGEYIAFCDSDDYLQKDFLETLYTHAVSANADCVICDYNIVDESYKICSTSKHSNDTQAIGTPEERFSYILNFILGGKHGWEIWTRLFKARIICENNLRFPTTCRNYAEDLGFVLQYTLHTKKICSLSYFGYNYYLRNNSMMRNSAPIVKLDEMNEISKWFFPKYITVFNSKVYTNKFSILHFILVYFELQKIIGTNNYPYLPKYIDALNSKDWFIAQVKRIKKCKNYLLGFYGKRIAQQILLFSHFCVHRNWKRFGIESAIAYRFFIKE